MNIFDKYYKYIVLAGIREYSAINKMSIHKFNVYILYSLITMICYISALILGVHPFFLANITIMILILISFNAVEFDNFIIYCQNDNNRILLSYPVDFKNILMATSLKYILFYLRTINLAMIPLTLIIMYYSKDALFIIKIYILMNLLCIFSCLCGWTRWILKWQEVKTKKSDMKKILIIILSCVFCLVIVLLIKKRGFSNLDIFNNLILLNEEKYNFYEDMSYWGVVLSSCLGIYLAYKYIESQLVAIYKFYILKLDLRNINLDNKDNNIIKFIKKQKKLNMEVKKEFYIIFRNSNIYNEVIRKIKYSIIVPLILSIAYLIKPINFDFYSIVLLMIITITNYGDKIIRNYINISSEGKMIINYIQSGRDIRTVINNKVIMLFLYRQLFIIGPVVFILITGKFNIFKIAFFILSWVIVSYTSANIKVNLISFNASYFTTDDFFKKTNIFNFIKYMLIEISYFYLLTIITIACNYFIKSPIAVIIGIAWISIIYNIIIFILRGDGKKFYGEFKEYV